MALDPRISSLVKAIREVESGGNYTAKGASGEYGAYQFMPATWKTWAGEFLGDPNAPMTKLNQDKVAYLKAESLAKRGYKAADIAAAWNAGEGAVKNGQWKTMKGTNKYGVDYDVPAYVKKIGTAVNATRAQEQTTQSGKTPLVDPQTLRINSVVPSSIGMSTGAPNVTNTQGMPAPGVISGDQGKTGIEGFARGMGKRGWQLALGLGTPVQTALDATVNKVLPDNVQMGSDIYRPGTETRARFEDYLVRKTSSEKAGGVVTDIGAFAAPASRAASAARYGSNLFKLGTWGTRALNVAAQGATAAGVTAVGGGTKEDVATTGLVTAGLEAVLPPVGDAIVRNLPRWFENRVVSQTPTARAVAAATSPERRSAATILNNKGWVGTQSSLIKRAQTESEALSTAIDTTLDQVDDFLARQTNNAPVVSVSSIADDLVTKLNEAGGDFTRKEIIGTVSNFAPNIRGLLKKDGLTLKEFNLLRRGIDAATKDTQFLTSKNPIRVAISKDFATVAREQVKQVADDTVAQMRTSGKVNPEIAQKLTNVSNAFEEWAKNITLEKALLKQQSMSTGRNAISLMDALAAGTGYATGGTFTAALLLGGRRVLESTLVKTFGAASVRRLNSLLSTDQGTALLNAYIQNVRNEKRADAIDAEEEDPQYGRVR